MKTAFQCGRSTPWALCLFAAIAVSAGPIAGAASIGASGSVVVTTDYVYRGLTQSGRKAALQADAHLQSSSGWFLGAWGSYASSAPAVQSRSEINLYLGRTWVLSPNWTTTAHYARYIYPDGRERVKYYYGDYDELQVAVSYQDRATVSVAYAPRTRRYGFGPVRRHGRQLAYESSLRQPLWRNLSATAGLGYYDVSDLYGHSYWAVSGAAELAFERLTVTLTRFEVDGGARQLFGAQSADGTWALTAAWRF